MSSVILLPRDAGQENYMLDVVQVTSAGLATEVAASQLQAVVNLLVKRGLHPVIIGDQWYACAPFLARMTDVAASCLLRVVASGVGGIAILRRWLTISRKAAVLQQITSKPFIPCHEPGGTLKWYHQVGQRRRC